MPRRKGASPTLDWLRLADHLRNELSRRGWTQHDLANRSGVSQRTINRTLSLTDDRGRIRKYIPHCMPAIERTLGWPPGTCRSIAEGGETRTAEVRISAGSVLREGAVWALAGFTDHEKAVMITAVRNIKTSENDA